MSVNLKLADIKTEFSKYFVIKDPYIIEIVLATMIGNMIIERDPLWTMLIGPSSGGKTTLLAPCATIPRVYFIDDLTEKTLLSGFKIKGKEMSLLRQIGSGMMVFSDFTSIMAKNPVSRGEILTQLKLVFDGKITKYTGLGGIPWEGKIGFLGAATPDVYQYLENSRSMGERFLYYWLEQPTNAEVMEKQKQLTLSSREITSIMQALYGEYYDSVKTFTDVRIPLLAMTDEQKARVHAAAVFCVNGKATIHTNFKTGKPDAIPNISGVGRDSKIFDTLLHTLQVMNCYEQDNYLLPVEDWMIDVVEKCAYSSINREKRKILEILVRNDSLMTTSQIGAEPGLGLERESVEQYLAPMHAVGMIRKKAGGGANKWMIDDPAVTTFVKSVSPRVVDKAPIASVDSTEVVEHEEGWGEFDDDETIHTPEKVS